MHKTQTDKSKKMVVCHCVPVTVSARCRCTGRLTLLYVVQERPERPTQAKPELLGLFNAKFGVAQALAQTGRATFTNMFATLQSLPKPHLLLNPPEASLMGYLQDYKASGTRRKSDIKRVPTMPRVRADPGAASLLSCKKTQLAPSPFIFTFRTQSLQTTRQILISDILMGLKRGLDDLAANAALPTAFKDCKLTLISSGQAS